MEVVSERRRILSLGSASSLLAAAILLVMAGITLSAGPDSTQLLQPTDPDVARVLMRDHAWVARTGILLDNLFVLAYTGAFIGLAALDWTQSKWLAGVAMLFALATAVLDFSENARLLNMAMGIGGEANFTEDALHELNIISQIKYLCSHLATFLFGLGLARDSRLAWLVSSLLFLFPIASTAALALEGAAIARLVIMWLMLALGGLLVRRHARQPSVGQ
jgi:hypothetical protein